MRYSFNLDKEGIVFAQKAEINASYKDLAMACAAIRYMRSGSALELLDSVISMEKPIAFSRFNKHMGSRHELGGKKGAYPTKAAKEVKEVLVNAISNANNKGMNGEDMFIVHAAANKTHIERRYPSKGSLAWGKGIYGRSAIVHSDLEYAKVEIGLGSGEEKGITDNMKYFIKKKNPPVKQAVASASAQKVKKGKQGKAIKEATTKKAEKPEKHEVEKNTAQQKSDSAEKSE